MSRSLTQYVSAFQGALAKNAIRGITIRSAISPDVTLSGEEIFGPGTPVNPNTGQIAMPGDPSIPAPPRVFEFGEALLRLSKPEFLIDTPAGLIHVAPYGRAKVNLFWPILILGGAGLLGLGILAAKGLAKD